MEICGASSARLCSITGVSLGDFDLFVSDSAQHCLEHDCSVALLV
jgi:hypothetical protein